MKSKKLIYWISTGLLAAMMLFSAYSYFTAEQMKIAFAHLGFPDYFRTELGIAKILGVIVILVPMIPARLKEWAYAGFTITFISAFIAHISSGDPAGTWIAPLVILGVTMASYFTKEEQ